VATLPLINPLVHGDGVGYYAYLRAPLIQHNLQFEEDWRHANLGFSEMRLSPDNQLHADQYTSTGHISNMFTIGPAILWTPFFLLAHAAVLSANFLGAHIPADGFSSPYRIMVAFGTSFYGFCGILLSYLLARRYLDPSWALLATLGIWAGSSLPVYMYFNPFWSHTLSAFMVALFLWYWDLTRPNRTVGQWIVLGIVSGMLVDVYYVNGVCLLVPLVEALQGYLQDFKARDRGKALLHRFKANLVYLAAFMLLIVPTLITRKIIFGGFFQLGAYTRYHWNWVNPDLGSILFSSDHGMLSWTPLLGFALFGLLLPLPGSKQIRGYLILVAVAFYYVISSYPYWDGLSAYGNRFFVSLTPVFIFGLALLLERVGGLFRSFRLAYAGQGLLLAMFAVWNLAFIFQWGTHLVPARGEISWSSMVHNQFVEVPRQMKNNLGAYFTHRSELMQNLEQKDLEQRKLEKRQGE
jgi:hypothetical protein